MKSEIEIIFQKQNEDIDAANIYNLGNSRKMVLTLYCGFFPPKLTHMKFSLNK